MNDQINISNGSLAIALVLVAISLGISYKQKLHLEKDTIISVTRAVIQLIIVGFLLKFIFNLNNVFLTLAMMVFIVFNAALNGKKRAHGIPGAFGIA
ncbi:ABC transporter permease, partial [Weissella soli]